MEFGEAINAARDALSVKRVFGDPIERNGVTVIPVAHVAGAGGGGGGGNSDGNGGGGGFGGYSWPAGVYVIRGDDVRWEPALDVTQVALRGMKVAVVLFRLLFAARRRKRRR